MESNIKLWFASMTGEGSRDDETDVYRRVLVKGPIPTIQAPNPLAMFLVPIW